MSGLHFLQRRYVHEEPKVKIPDFSQEFKGMDASFPCLTEQPTRYVTITGKLFHALSASPVNCLPYGILSTI